MINPATAPTMPVAAPLALMTRRMFLSVAPWAASMPIARSLRCASTVKPPMPVSAMRTMPSTAAVIEIVSGLITLVFATVCAV
jgi:hypothetical protein